MALAGEAGLLVIGWAVGRWLGIQPLDQMRATAAGALTGVAASVPLLLGLWWTLRTPRKSVRGLVELVQRQLGPLLASCTPVEVALLAIMAGTAEEIFFRGVVQVGLARILPQSLALVLASLAFGLAHFLTPTYAFLAGLAGMYLGAVFWVEGNLLTPIVAHSVYDFVALTYLVRRHRAAAE